MKYCIACGMPLIKKEDFSQGNENSEFCCFCTDSDEKIKTVEEIFEGGVNFFMSQLGDDRIMAEKIVRKNMNQQPYWKDKNLDILKGEMVTDEEFAEILNKLN